VIENPSETAILRRNMTSGPANIEYCCRD